MTTDQLQEKAHTYRAWIIGVVILIVAAILTFVIIKIARALKKPANATYVPGAPLPIGWTPTQVTDGIYHAIDGTFVSSDVKDSAYKSFNELNDNQQIEVYNDWLKRYYNQKKFYLYPYGSLTNAIKNKIGYVSITGDNNQDIALANLGRLKLP